jgi:CheY-like chemotaxis protein
LPNAYIGNVIRIPATQRTILVVDDDPLVCETLTLLLQFDGHKVDTAINGDQALALYQPGKFDLVITDFFMPTMTGDKLASAIKIRDPQQPVVMATAYLEKLQGPVQAQMKVDLFIPKPFEIESLRAAISLFRPTDQLVCTAAPGRSMFSTNFLFASLIWGSVGLGYFVYGKAQQSWASMVGGLLLMAFSYLVGSALVMSLSSIAIIGAVHALLSRSY